MHSMDKTPAEEGCVEGGEGKGRARGTSRWCSTAISKTPTVPSSYNFIRAAQLQSPLCSSFCSDPQRVGLPRHPPSAASAVASSLLVVRRAPGMESSTSFLGTHPVVQQRGYGPRTRERLDSSSHQHPYSNHRLSRCLRECECRNLTTTLP